MANSPARPKRNIREPKRFRDVVKSQKVPESEKTSIPVNKDDEKTKIKNPRVSLSRVKVTSETPGWLTFLKISFYLLF